MFRGFTLGLATASMLLVQSGEPAGAADLEGCRGANLRLERTGKGDRDFDGLSNCVERRIVGTAALDPDSDDDSMRDGDEMEDGTDPLDPDTDDDGMDDGEESDSGTDPSDPDSDGDGELDGEDEDPTNELASKIEGDLELIECPLDEAGGVIVVLGIEILLMTDTDFDGVADCADLAEQSAAGEGVHVEVEVSGHATTGFEALEVEVEDADHDGSPDDSDEDDDDDGTPEDEDEQEDEDEHEDEDGQENESSND